MDEDEEEVTPLEGVRWSWLSPVILLLSAVGSIIGSISDLFTDLTVAIARHSIWAKEQEQFRSEASKEIERITEG